MTYKSLNYFKNKKNCLKGTFIIHFKFFSKFFNMHVLHITAGFTKTGTLVYTLLMSNIYLFHSTQVTVFRKHTVDTWRNIAIPLETPSAMKRKQLCSDCSRAASIVHHCNREAAKKSSSLNGRAIKRGGGGLGH